jgi:hypothetical protein
MTLALVYWVAAALIGFAAAIGSWIVGLSYYRYLNAQRPELVAAYRSEFVRDSLLVVGLGLNLLVGITASLPKSDVGGLIGTVAILGGATCVSAFAVFNFWLRANR